VHDPLSSISKTAHIYQVQPAQLCRWDLREDFKAQCACLTCVRHGELSSSVHWPLPFFIRVHRAGWPVL
jgi:hypothetical protein